MDLFIIGSVTEFNEFKRSLIYLPPVQILNHRFTYSLIFNFNNGDSEFESAVDSSATQLKFIKFGPLSVNFVSDW